ncbi:unnamed protein product [Acanthoscelides obtectus]|uniref:Uncharacterized protein n=1 Tax=Acanthoscelides obtectus TaxID=200917 RepID=A0A9P0L3R7_ACAOB|nr:unnamed protein product [Acanthoscelides obtectus]CAK1632728.1 hypothetical protein AOBTE_LOCUS7699 [Acanthoscelides obtectus]
MTAQPPRKVRDTPIVLRDASRWRGVSHKFISLGIKFDTLSLHPRRGTFML